MISDPGTAAIGEIIQNGLRFDMKNWSTHLISIDQQSTLRVGQSNLR
jgi:hypothetical protein